MICYTIEAALNSGCFDEIYISSEDHDILNVAKNYPVEIHKRARSLATDESTVAEVCLDVLREFKLGSGKMMCLYATSPLRDSQDILKTFELVDGKNCKRAYAATNFGLPVEQSVTVDLEGFSQPVFPNQIEASDPTSEEFWVDNGSTYCVDIDAFYETNSFLFPDAKIHKMPRKKSIDVNELFDFELVKFLMQKNEGSQ